MTTNAPAPSKDQPFVIDGIETISKLGHREFVGGMWDEIGKLQFDFLVQQGLRPRHCFLDVACGCLRGGVHLINYLYGHNYLGIDKEQVLIDSGIEELGQDVFEQKKPQFVVSRSFEFDKFAKTPDFAIAQSLFTHLIAEDIELCMRNLRAFVNPGHVFYATYFDGPSEVNPTESNSRQCFWYSPEQMQAFGTRNGWHATYLGNWNHPRGQVMMRYIAI